MTRYNPNNLKDGKRFNEEVPFNGQEIPEQDVRDALNRLAELINVTREDLEDSN